MSEPFSFVDRRGMNRTASNFYVGDPNTEMRRLRQAGYTLPNSPVQARLEAKRVADTATRGASLADSVTAAENRARTSAMRRQRMSGSGSTGAMSRTASNVQMAMPKIRQPFSSLEDKGIPFNVQDPRELTELRRWCRLYYSTHDLVPLLIDIYSKFPVVGLEFQSQDKKIQEFYEQMFMDDLNYGEFLSEGLGREYFTVGEVTSLAHFNESLGIWSSEEILNPDMIRVSKSLFVQEERVQLMVKELVDNLRSGPNGGGEAEETHSERLERTWEYCCTPETKVLTASMEWVPVRSLLLGDKIMGFDEFAPGGKGNGRCFRETEVTATSIITAPVFDVETSGPKVTCTGAHMWLAQHKSYDYTWIRTDQLQPGDKIRYLGEWDYEDNADTGYVAGIFDGEGHFHNGHLAFSQKPGPVLDKAVDILQRYKFDLAITNISAGCKQVRIRGGISEMARAIGIFRPVRLTSKFYEWLDGRALAGSSFKPVVVQSVIPAGTADVVALATSTKTLMAAGMFSHNTQLVKQYPEIVKAAAQDDGLDISDALVSRLVNKASWWDLRGTPHLLRSFRTLMMEESLNAAQDAVADRLYAPMILATMGIENMGDGEPWIPDQGELDDLRDDMQNALAADFKLLVHNFGVNVQSVFGRESVPRFDQDYDRIDAKLLQAWGIGQALIAGGSGAGGTYASSALNREVCEQLMLTFQKKVLRHMRKRAEVIAEAQEHYDYDLKGGLRVPIYREIVQYNEETGEEEIVRVPKLLLPDIEFATLNLRDEAQERQFIAQLKQMGVPVSDGTLAVNIPIKFDQELERQAEETVSKGLATAQAMDKLQKQCDEQGLPYPPDLVQSLSATLQLRQGLAQTELVEGQATVQEMQIKQSMPAGQMGLIPGVPAPPQDPEQQGGGGQGGAQPKGGSQQKAAAIGPVGIPPQASGPGDPVQPTTWQDAQEGQSNAPAELPRNRQRPAESDEQRGAMPKGGKTSKISKIHDRKLSKFEKGPSSYGKAKTADAKRVERAILRRANGVSVEDLVNDPEAYEITGMSGYESQIRADWPEIQAGGAKESRKLLEELVEQYEEVTGVKPRWN